MFEILKKAGISKAEFAVLVGVSRNMVNRWENGSSPHELRMPIINSVLRAIKSATDAKELPIEKINKNQVAMEYRNKKLKDIVSANMKKPDDVA